MIREGFRLLKSQGIAVFSVVKKYQPTNFLNFMISHCESFGIKIKERYVFKLGEEGVLRNLMIENGFERVLEANCSVCYNMITADEVVETAKLMPPVKYVQTEYPEFYEQLLINLRTEGQKIIDSGNAFVYD